MNSRDAAKLGRKQIALLVTAGVGAILVGAAVSPFASSGGEVAEVVVRRDRATAHARPAPIQGDSARVEATEARLAPRSEHNPFAGLDFSPAVPASLGKPSKVDANKKVNPQPAAALEPAPPAALPVPPPLPFKVIGAIAGATENGPVAFLQFNESLLVVRAGEQIGGQYLVESVSRDRIDIMYLPLKQRQFLTLAQ